MKEKFEAGDGSARERKEAREKNAEEWAEDFRGFYKDLLGKEIKLSKLEIPLAKEEAAQKLGARDCGVRAIAIPKDLRLEDILEGAKRIVDFVEVEGYERHELETLGNRGLERSSSLSYRDHDEYEYEKESQPKEAGAELVWVRNRMAAERGVAKKNGRRYVNKNYEDGYDSIPEYEEDFTYGRRRFTDQLEGIGRFITLREEIVNQLKLLKENPDNLGSFEGVKCSGSINREGEGSEEGIYSIPRVSTFKDDEGRVHLAVSKAEYTPYGSHMAHGVGTEGDEESKWPSRVVAS